MKELIVLNSADAPTSWTFPLTVQGVTPRLDAESGAVLFVDDETAEVRGSIPAGFMYDSAIDPRSGDPATSHAVAYSLHNADGTWTLRVDLDGGWLRDPARRFPVTVDPTLRRNTEVDDTFASSRDWKGSDGSSDTVLRVGTYDGVEKAASYLHFNGVMSALSNKYILGASLNLYNVWSYSCRPYPIAVYRVTEPWSGSGVRQFPGPAYDAGDMIAWNNFAYGYDSCSNDTWVSFYIPGNRMTDWVHGTQPFHGFTLRSDFNSKDSWKKFASANYGNASATPFLDVNYSDEGASYALPNANFDPPVTTSTAGKITARVTNWGGSTWTPSNGFRLTHTVVNSSGATVHTGTYPVPHNVGPHQSADIPINVGALPVGSYTLRLDMINPSGAAFQPTYGSSAGTAGFSVANGPPTINGNNPPNNGTVDSLTPTLWASYYDPDNYPLGGRRFEFQICTGPAGAGETCTSSGWTNSPGWQVPAELLRWSETAHWYVTVSDSQAQSGRIGPLYFTPIVPQPPITSHLAGAPDGGDMPNVNPQVGNYTRTVTDISVAVHGPALGVSRTYNSQDLRTSGAFGTGWSTPLDQRLTIEPGGDVVLSAPSGDEIRFGSNSDGTFAPPPGRNLTLAEDDRMLVLRDATGARRVFDRDGTLQATIDADGRAQTYHYRSTAEGSQLYRVTDATSGRSLHLTWTGRHITSAATDPPAQGQPAPTWTYTYTGDELTKVCAPLSSDSCTSYTYQDSSHYRTVVSDDNPTAHWPLGESSGSVAVNVAARSSGEYDATYSSVTLGLTGAVQGSSDKAAAFNGSSTSRLRLPDNLISSASTFSTELWFKAATGQQGVLLSTQNTLPGRGRNRYTPMLYVGQDGLLRGRAPTGQATGAVIGHADKCLDVRTSLTTDGTPVQLYPCNGTDAQQWTFGSDGTVRAFGKCLDVSEYGTSNGSKLHLWQCHGGANQVWRFNGTALVNPVSNRCADTPSDADSTQLHLWECHSGENQQWNPTGGATSIASTARVDDGQWHHAVLSITPGRQTLHLDGHVLGSLDAPLEHGDQAHAMVGDGIATGWAQAPAGRYPFTGVIDEVAFYRRALSGTQSAAHYDAAVHQTKRLTSVVEPGAFTAATVTYNPATGRVTTNKDRNGATWNLGAPTVGNQRREVVVNSSVRDAVTYTYDTANAGRLLAREDSFGRRSWEYNAAGFVSKSTDENGNSVLTDTDSRGNVIARTTCRGAGQCNTAYYGYFLNPANPLDPRNDVQIWHADARSANATDTTYRTLNDIDAAGRTVKTTYPLPAGHTVAPTETFTYSASPTYNRTTAAQPFIPAEQIVDLHGDDAYTTIDLPFPVPFYGRTRTSIKVSTNGYASFAHPTDTNEGHDPYVDAVPLPTTAPAEAVYPLWDDLVVDEQASIRTTVTGTAPNRQFVIEWRNVHPYGQPSNRFSFEAVFSESGAITFNYSGLNSPEARGSEATVGVSDLAGIAAVQHSHATTALQSGTTVVFTPQPTTTPVPGLLTSATATNGGVTQHSYNTAGDRTRTVDAAGLTTDLTYDALGRPTTSTQSAVVNGAPVTYGTTTTAYNPLSQPATVTAPPITNPITGVVHTAQTAYTYDAAGRPTNRTISDTTGADPPRTTAWTYDPAGRLTSEKRPDNTVTTQDWDTAGDLVGSTDPSGPALRYTYDDAHRRVETTAVGAGVDPMNTGATTLVLESRAYDPAGRLSAVVDAMGRETALTYYSDDLPATITRVRRDSAGTVTSTTTLAEYTYDQAGNLTRETGVSAISTAWTYDPAGYTTTETFDPNGLARTTTYSNNRDGTIARAALTAPQSPGRTERVDYTYDPAARLLTETVDNTGGNPATITTRVERDPRGLPTRVTEPGGAVSDITYDAEANPVTVTGAARTSWTNGIRSDGTRPTVIIGRNTFGDVTHQRDPLGATTTLTVDAMGRTTEATLPPYTPPGAGSPIIATSRTEYNGAGLPAKTIDGLGRETTYTYDPYGRVTRQTLPDPDGTGPKTSPVWAAAYDRLGEILDATDPTGAHILATWDDLGRQRTETRSERISGQTVYYTTEFGYDAAGNVNAITSPLGKTTTATYDAAGNPTRVTDPTGRFIATGYDLADRPVMTVQGQGTTFASPAESISYDLAGRPTTHRVCTTAADGSCATVLKTRSWTYDAADRVTQAGSFAGRVTTYTYDGAGQRSTISERVDPTNPATAVTTHLGYDPAGRQTRLTDGNGNTTDYTYNVWGLPESTIEPATPNHPALTDRTWTTHYDRAGQPIRESLPGGIVRDRTFDALGRLTAETGTGAETATADRRLDYDAADRPTKISGPTGDTTYAWNDRGLLTQTTAPGANATFGYNADGRLISRTDPTDTTSSFTYDDAGRLATAADPLTNSTATFAYTPTGQVANVGYGTGKASRVYTYDNHGRVVTDTWKRPDGSAVASTTYGYDNDDLLTSKITTGFAGAGSNAYSFDGLARLATWTRPDGQTITYGYDQTSNRTTVTGPGGTRTTAYDARNRALSSTGGGKSDEQRTWTARGTLRTVTSAGSATTYTNDAFERLIQVAAPINTTTYTYDALDRVAQRNGTALAYVDLSNNPTTAPTVAGQAKIVRTPDGQPLSDQSSSGPGRILITDPIHHDVTAAADPTTGSLGASASYDPYGTPSASGTLPLGFQGGVPDPQTGHVNAHARWYEPATGAFTSRDTWTLDPDPTTQVNRYLYGNANPITGADPTGHYCTYGQTTCPPTTTAPGRTPPRGGGGGLAGLILVGVGVAIDYYTRDQRLIKGPHYSNSDSNDSDLKRNQRGRTYSQNSFNPSGGGYADDRPANSPHGGNGNGKSSGNSRGRAGTTTRARPLVSGPPRVAPRPAEVPINDRAAHVDITGGAPIGNLATGLPEAPHITESAADSQPAPIGSPDDFAKPAQGQLKSSCAPGALVRSDGTRSAQIFECNGSGGRRGGSAVRTLNQRLIAMVAESNPGWELVGGGYHPETGQKLPEIGFGPKRGGTWADFTFRREDGQLIHFQTVDELKSIRSPDVREAWNAVRLARQSGDPVIMIGKKSGDWWIVLPPK
ncbi:ricin-type beta-trefoil lectin domain protein [Virgisporangium aliadipatigenens]|uniref:ricin-type beta-trefoil lectin domain protein n=1 Tax=Virgisporangium aliadipatigenens TaxID=741659 RepID=UPI0019442A0B|nr:ricin-type beta-trefoil lectin domain protein [Virgisporangium aliadipatigenens]